MYCCSYLTCGYGETAYRPSHPFVSKKDAREETFELVKVLPFPSLHVSLLLAVAIGTYTATRSNQIGYCSSPDARLAFKRLALGLIKQVNTNLQLQFSWSTTAVLNGGKLFAVEPSLISCDSNGAVDLQHLRSSVDSLSTPRDLRGEIYRLCNACDGEQLHVLLAALQVSARSISMVYRVFGQLTAQIGHSLEQRLILSADLTSPIPREVPELDPRPDLDDDIPDILVHDGAVYHADNSRKTDMELLRYQKVLCMIFHRQ